MQNCINSAVIRNHKMSIKKFCLKIETIEKPKMYMHGIAIGIVVVLTDFILVLISRFILVGQ